MNNKTTLLTEGSIPKKIILFAIPIFLGQLFQQLYNTADSLIVGNYLGSEALAAVSSSGNLIFLMIGLFNGIFAGAGVVVSRFYGAKDKKALHRTIHTTIAFAFITGIILTFIGVIFAPQMLIWMNTPEDVLPLSTTYFKIYFLGSLPFILYNALNGILQAVGDSKHPLIFLIVSSITNVILDIFFIGVLNMGVGAAALATIISQALSAILCLHHLLKAPEDYRINLKEIKIHLPLLSMVIRNGLPAGVQNSIISFANVIVQSYINSFGKIAMAGSGSYSKIEGFGFLPITCFAMAMTTFISQNLGANQPERAKKGAQFGILTGVILAECIGLIIYNQASAFIQFFDSNPQVVQYGSMHARTVSLFYFLLAFSHIVAGVLRGAGKAIVPMLVMMVCWCVVRVTYISIVIPLTGDIEFLYMAYPFTWTLSSILFFRYYTKINWKNITL